MEDDELEIIASAAADAAATATTAPGTVDSQVDAPRRELMQTALLERPWAIQRSMLALMSRTGSVPKEAASGLAGPVAAQSFLDRIGGAMVGGTAVIPVYGVISHRSSFWSWLFGGASLDALSSAIREVMADPATTSVILDIDSPGGSVDGLPEFAAQMRAMRGGPKPIVAVANALAASAAYWIAAQADEVVITPSGEVGSVGVYALHEDDSAALEMAGIKITLISAGPFKTEGNPYEPLSDEARAAIQEQVDAFYQMFLTDVAKGRSVPANQVTTSFGGGRTLLAKPALAAGMVDRIDTLENTVSRLASSSRSRRSAELAPSPITAIAAAAPKRRPVTRDEFPALLARGGNR